MKTITIETFLHYINEVVSRKTYRDNFLEKEIEHTKSEKYKKVLRDILKKFFTLPGSTIPKRTLVIPLKDNKKKFLSLNDKKIVKYLNENGYSCTRESYDLGQCTNKNNKIESILNVLTQIESYDIAAEKKKLDNVKVPDIGKQQARERIERFNNLDKNLVNYYEKTSNLNKQVIVFTWVPRKIASQSTNVGWTSCQNLFDGEQKSFVFPSIGEGAFIAWLVKRGDEDKLDNPIARTLIKIYKDSKGKNMWWPDAVYGTPSPLFLERVKDFLREKQVDNNSKEIKMIKGQYDDGQLRVRWNPWKDEKEKEKNNLTLSEFEDLLNYQKYSKAELTKIILDKLEKSQMTLNSRYRFFQEVCRKNYYELAFRLYKRYQSEFRPTNDLIAEIAENSPKIAMFLIKDKRIEFEESTVIKIIESDNEQLFEYLIENKKILLNDKKTNQSYVLAAANCSNILKLMLKYENYFNVSYDFIEKLNPDKENAVYIIKTVLKKIGHLITRDQKNALMNKYIDGSYYNLCNFLIKDMKFKYDEKDQKEWGFYSLAITRQAVNIINLLVDNIPISRKDIRRQFDDAFFSISKESVEISKILFNKKMITETDLLDKYFLNKTIKYFNRFEDDDELKVFVLNKFKKFADEYNKAKAKIKYIEPRNLNVFDYTKTFERFSPSLIKKMIDEKENNYDEDRDWFDFHDRTNHDLYNKKTFENAKEFLLKKRNLYNSMVEENRQISEKLISEVFNDKQITKKEKIDFVNFLYFIIDNRLNYFKNESYDDIFDIVAYKKAFNIREKALENALGPEESIIETTEEVKPEIPKIKVKDYISRRYYNDIDEDQEENIGWVIEDFYRAAIDKLKLTDIKEITKAIKTLMADNYVENDIALEIFKKTIEDDNIIGALQVNMPLYREYEKKI